MPQARNKESAALEHQILDALLVHCRTIIGVKDLDGRYLVVNAEYARAHGISRTTCVGKTDHELFPADIAERLREADQCVSASRDSIVVEELASYGGITHAYLSIKFPIFDGSEKVFATGFIASDITDQKRAEETLLQTKRQLEASNTQLIRLSMTDQLTQLGNRRCFETESLKEIARSTRYNNALSIALIDIDKFKRINDSFGHSAGDVVLAQLATLLADSLRQNDQVMRWGGEEFVMLLPETPEMQAEALALRTCRLISSAIFPQARQVTISIGVAQFTAGFSLKQWLSKADVCLYQAKSHGGNCVMSAESALEPIPSGRRAT